MHDESDIVEDDSHEDRELNVILEALAAAPRPALGGALRAQLPAPLKDSLTAENLSDVGKPPSVGELVDGRYRVEGVLGEGGMGIVFVATHLKTHRRVALKWLRFDASYRSASEQDVRLERFAREAHSAGRIRHPNVVDIYDAGTSPTGPFFVMEHLEGETLRARIERATFQWDEALQVFLPITAGVSEAHRCGVVHRDLKPDNILLAKQSDGSIRATILDFGISRLSSPDSLEEHASLTKTGAILGTPAYMPLEQLRAGGDLDARTDVYALGVVLYEMLSQHRPYVARNAADFAALIACERPTPLSRYRPDLRGARERVVMKALERSPSDRYQSVAAFADALAGAQRERPFAPYLRYSAGLALIGLALGYWTFSHSALPVSPVRAAPHAATGVLSSGLEGPSTLPIPAALSDMALAESQMLTAHAPKEQPLHPPKQRSRVAQPPGIASPEPLKPELVQPAAVPSRTLALDASDFSRPSPAHTPNSAAQPTAAPPIRLKREHF